MNKYIKALIITILIISYLLFTNTAINFFMADYYNKLGKNYLTKGYLVRANELVNKALKLNSKEPTYHRTNAAILIGAAVSTEASEEDKKMLKTHALLELNYAYHLQQSNIVNIKNLIPLYYFLSTTSLVEKDIKIDDTFKPQALAFYKEVEDVAPTDASMYLLLGKYYRLLNEKQRAYEILNKALSLKPDLAEAKEELEFLKTQTN